VKLQSLIGAKRVEFDPVNKFHSVYEIRNQTEVPLFPSVVNIDFIAKLLLDSEERMELELMVFDPDGTRSHVQHIGEVTNRRLKEMEPGVDFNFNVRFPVVAAGTYWIAVYGMGERLGDYPLYIQQKPSAEASALS